MSTKTKTTNEHTPWLESVSELYRTSDRRVLVKLVANLVDREVRTVSAADPYGHNLGLLEQSHYFFFQVAPQLYS
jgi:hypothetical protein